jgi:hypothetical protein
MHVPEEHLLGHANHTYIPHDLRDPHHGHHRHLDQRSLGECGPEWM